MDVVNNRRATFKKILNVTSGNFLEQYDFFLFGFYATYIAAKFFHSENEYVSLMMTFTVLAVMVKAVMSKMIVTHKSAVCSIT